MPTEPTRARRARARRGPAIPGRCASSRSNRVAARNAGALSHRDLSIPGATRQQLRAAARRLARRHRRNPELLRWIGRVAAESSLLSLVLLGLTPAGADAASVIFRQRTGTSNALLGLDVGSRSVPTHGDLDADGDPDLVAGASNGAVAYLRNTGNADLPAYCQLTSNTSQAGNPAFCVETGSPIPFAGETLGSNAAPALGDLDRDGDLDALFGAGDGSFAYFENTGNAATAGFLRRTGAANPLDGASAGIRALPALADLDADGDLDLVAGSSTGVFALFENTGDARAPAFSARSGAANPFEGFDVGSDAAPALLDADADGDLDLVAGNSLGALSYFDNSGDASLPAFAARSAAQNPFGGAFFLPNPTPAAVDFDRDGDADLIAGNANGRFIQLERRDDGFLARSGAENPLAGIDVGSYASPALGDLDGDGDLDAVAASEGWEFFFFENTALAGDPATLGFAPLSVAIDLDCDPDPGTSPPACDSDASPALVDLDDDGDLDLVSGMRSGRFAYFENTGSPAAAAFVRRRGSALDPFDGLDAGALSKPAFGNFDRARNGASAPPDLDFDLVAGEGLGGLRYFENTGTPAAPAFVQRASTSNPLGAVDVGLGAAPSIGDLDFDFDLDLIAGESFGRFRFIENTGNTGQPRFQLRSALGTPLVGEDVGSDSAPALGDLDGDGDLELVAGNAPGALAFFENRALQRDPSVAVGVPPLRERTGAENPLAALDLPSAVSLGFADLDADGDADLSASESGGAVRYFANTGSATQAAFLEQSGAANPFASLGLGATAPIGLADLDSDGDLDLIAGLANGALALAANSGSATAPAFAALQSSPFGLGVLPSAATSLALADLDADADSDLLVSLDGASLSWFENTGSAVTPAFAPLVALVDASGGGAALRSLAASDLDRDGDLDLVLGSPDGTLYWLANTGQASAPDFSALAPGPSTPVALLDLGADSVPAIADLNRDAAPEIAGAAAAAALRSFEVPEPSRALGTAVGAALLAWLERWRRRTRRLR